jgi:hypothetical protein
VTHPTACAGQMAASATPCFGLVGSDP